MKERRRLSALSFVFAALALPACQTQQIEAPNVLVIGGPSGPDRADVMVQIAPADATYEAEQARYQSRSYEPQYHVLIDGDYVSEPTTDGLWAVVVEEGGGLDLAYVAAGPHEFTIMDPNNEPIFNGEGDVPGTGTLRFFLYGSLDAPQGLFVPIPNVPASGDDHITVANLLQSGQTIEVVSCTNATTCTAISPALALGDVFDADVPAIPSHPCSMPLGAENCDTLADGVGVGYRLVPSAALPNPPVNAVYQSTGSYPPAGNVSTYLAAPIYISDQGQVQLALD
jgi:hypothetical protein